MLEFGTSGMLYRSNKLMYDRGTNTLWHQFLGEPAVGPLADSGLKLELIPVLVTTWQEWLSTHPDTTVLSIDTGVYPRENYKPETNVRSIYFDYRNSPGTMFPVAQQSNVLPIKAQVLGLGVNGQFRAYPLETLLRDPVINDSLGGQEVVVVTSDGGGARAYERGSHWFSLAEDEGLVAGDSILLDQEGRRWRVGEDSLDLMDGHLQRLARLPGHMAYWFGWYAFHPITGVYGVGDTFP